MDDAAIQESLDRLMAGKTVIAVAHRLSTLERMDRPGGAGPWPGCRTGQPRATARQGGVHARLWQCRSGGFIGD
jgi:ABC-type bacteriocin/lantibiotic exporter with double-glycine peptidase domain